MTKTAALLLTGAIACFAQTLTTGTVVGTITDASGAIVHGAIVTLAYPATGDTRSTISGEDGQYRFPC